MPGGVTGEETLGRLPLVPETLRINLEDASNDRGSRLARLLGGETTAFATLSVGDLLYDTFRIDPLAVEGIDFARAADLSDILHLARFAEGLAALSGRSETGAIAQLHGYVAERVAAHALLAMGADVSFPATSTQAGWDLLVNGQRFQVKCLATPAGVHEHLSRYPDIPVICNSELGRYFTGDDRVTTLAGLNHDDVVTITRGTLDGAADLLDLQIPLIATTVGAARAATAILFSGADPVTALQAAAVGVAAGAGGGKVGAAAAGVALGALGVAGSWLTIMAPMFGGILGFKGGRLAADLLKRKLLCRAEAARLEAASRAFASAVAGVLSLMVANSERYRRRVVAMPDQGGAFPDALQADWLRRIDLELDRRRFYRDRLMAAAAEPASIEPTASDPRVHAMRIMWEAARSGVLEVNVKKATENLKQAVGTYNRALRNWLLS